MNRIFMGIVILIAVSDAVYGNMRAPLLQDYYYSGSLSIREKLKSLELKSESIEVRFALIHTEGKNDSGIYADFVVTYRMENTSDNAIKLPVRFIAVMLTNLSVTVNGADSPSRIVGDTNEYRVLLRELVDHRKGWLPDIYDRFIRNADSIIGDASAKDINTEQMKQIWGYGMFNPNSQMGLREFEPELKPGMNDIRVKYRQLLFVREFSPQYHGINYGDSAIGFDYPLYPAVSWRMARDFTMDLTVSVPDYIKDGAPEKERFVAPKFDCNLRMGKVYSLVAHTRVFRGIFKGGFPKKFFSVMLTVREN